MQMMRSLLVVAGLVLVAPTPASGQGQPSVAGSSDTGAATPSGVDLRLTLSSFLFRETGADAPAIVDQGAELENASPVKRYFGDLRMELAGAGLTLDARVRQTTSQRFQSGASGGGEYEIRTLAYRLGSARTSLTLGRQFIEAVGATKVDGLAFTQQLTRRVAATLFGGAFPQLGSRSLETDYPRIRNEDGTEGSILFPLTGGLGLAYQTTNFHGDLGVAGIYVSQTVPNATSQEASRVFTTSSGYWRPVAMLDIYHFALLDVAGANDVALTNGSLGIAARPVSSVQLTASLHHVGTDVLQITTRNLLTDPDPTAIGIVQNNLAVIRVSQDMVRGGASLALARQRFEISVSGGVHRRPEVSVALADGTGTVAFPETRSADAMFTVLDRRSVGGLRASLTGILTFPIGSTVTNRARGTTVRIAASKLVADERGQLEADVSALHFTDVDSSTGECMTSLDIFACYGTSDTKALQAGVLASWRVGREWMILADTHLGYRDMTSTSISGPVVWPTVYSLTAFLRVQWRYR
jgi:hypothetical protein